jgi:hypothetical protein
LARITALVRKARSLGNWARRSGICDAATQLGSWQRHPESSMDFHSLAYEDMMFFHPFIRKAFFDTGDSDRDNEALVHRYVIPARPDSRLFYEAEDCGGESARVEITNLTLLIFANGIGILSIGVEAHNIPYSRALWINEMMRKIYPSSRDSTVSRTVLRWCGRSPEKSNLSWKSGGRRAVESAVVRNCQRFCQASPTLPITPAKSLKPHWTSE